MSSKPPPPLPRDGVTLREPDADVRRLVLVAACLVALVHQAAYFALDRPIQTDVRYFLYFAGRVADGALPHRDLFDPKTQLATFVGAFLFRVGEAVGLDGLTAIRLGFLGLASLSSVLVFLAFRELAGSLAGLAALLVTCAFPVLAVLPAIGNIPKLLLALAIPALGLCLHRKRWRLAGLVAGIAVLDWQPGAILGLVALVAALAQGERRKRAVLDLLVGGALVVGPYVLLFALGGALDDLFRQTVLAPFHRSASSLEGRDLGERMARMIELVASDCPGRGWLFLGGSAAGLPALVFLARRLGPDARRLLLGMAACHLALIALAFVDFQGHGDFFLLAHAASFLTACALSVVLLALRGRPRPIQALAAVGLLVVARPGPFAPDLGPEVFGGDPDLTLGDQREVSLSLRRSLEGSRVLFLENAEALFLARGKNLSRHVYWNHQLGGFLGVRRGRELLERLLEQHHPDAVVFYSPERPGRLGEQRRIVSRDGAYEVWVDVLEGDG